MGSITKGLGKLIKPINKAATSIFGDELGQALTMAAVVAGTIYGGGALAGAAGVEGASGMAALGSTAGTAATAGAGLMTYQNAAGKKEMQKQEANEQLAKIRADDVAREQEITRKKAMLAEANSLTARANAARNVRNNLQGLSTNTKKLGNEDEKLGG